jgi:cation diffusion facilitator family transporter
MKFVCIGRLVRTAHLGKRLNGRASGVLMEAKSNTWVVLVAVGANVAITISKFVAAAFTGSSAMLAEGIHSLVDAGNGGLLLLGEHLARRPPDEEHPFGHGREIFFWSFLVAVVIFGVGGGISVYRGITHLLHPSPVEQPFWNYAVLGTAFLFDGISWVFTFRGFRKTVPAGSTVWRHLHTSKDPSLYTVLLEDTSDLAGLLIAFTGVLVGHLTGNPYADGVATILIGLLLAVVAAFLAYEGRGLLLGESADPASVRGMRALAQAEPSILQVDQPMTVYLAPHQVLLILAVRFRPDLTLQDVQATIERLETRIRQAYPDVQRIFIEAKSLSHP